MNLNLLADRFKEDEFKDKEVARFEATFPGARVVQDHYDSERELEEDWLGYCSLPYSLKVLCNERCLRLYGKKNEEQYLALKKEFMRKDISNANSLKRAYRPSGLMEGEEVDQDFLNKQAQEYMDHGGHSILRTDYTDLHDLNSAYYDFNNQCYEHKMIANDKSREIYGCSVPELYQREVRRFLMADIKDSGYDKPLRHVVTDSLSATEAVFEHIRNSRDLIESLLFTEIARMEASTPVEKSLVSLMESNCIGMESAYMLPVGRNPQFFLPWEVMDILGEDSLMVDPMFVNYYARNLGIKPVMEGYQEKVRHLLETETDTRKLMSVGWLPLLPFNEENATRANLRANLNMSDHMHYDIVNISHTPAMLTESDEIAMKPKSLSILILKELDQEHKEVVQDVPKVLVTFDQDDPMWWAVLYGQLAYRQNVDSVIRQYSIPSASCYFIQVSDPLYDALEGNIEWFNQGNQIQKVTMALQTGAPEIADKGLFVMNLANSLIYPEYGEQPLPLRLNDRHDGSMDVIHLVYSEMNPSWRKIHDAYSKLSIYTEYTELENSFYFENCNMIATLNEQIEDYSIGMITRSYLSEGRDKWKDFRGIFDASLQSVT